MRRLTEQDLTAIIGTVQHGYTIKQARVKSGNFSDSDHYGIILGENSRGSWVTWQYHLDEEEPSIYWGHYIEKEADALADYSARQ
jgi:hypothetical protein